MSDEINFTDSLNKGYLTVNESSVNTETSLGYPGKNYVNYGPLINENFLHLLENFAKNTSPPNPVEGQLWYDTSINSEQLKIYNGAQWISAAGIRKSPSMPVAESNNIGDIWVNTATQQMYINNGVGWTLVGPEFSQGSNTGSKFELLDDISSPPVSHPVVINYANNVPVSIVSASAFTPKINIPGFDVVRTDGLPKINRGINLNSNISGHPAKFWGTVERAEKLVIGNTVVDPSELARTGVENIFTKPVRVRDDTGITVGVSQTLNLQVEGSNSVITNNPTDGSLVFRVNDTGITNQIVTLKNRTMTVADNVNILNDLSVLSAGVFGDALTSLSDPVIIAHGNVVINGELEINNNVDASGQTVTIGDLLPSATSTIGSELNQFNSVYATNFYGNFVGEVDVSGFLDGTASIASRLQTAATITVTGDVTAPPVVYNGTQSAIDIVTELSEDFVDTKPAIANTITDDQLLVSRSGTLRKISRSNFFNAIGTVPVGAIIPFGGNVPPAGWALCNGATFNNVQYEQLFSVIGFKYGQVSANDFRLPDLRERTTRGALDPDFGISNAYGGSENVTLVADQLPQHTHQLVGDEGTGFYAVTNNTVSLPDTDAVPVFGTIEAGTTTYGISETGENIVSVQAPVPVLDPFAAVNYIIYHGVF